MQHKWKQDALCLSEQIHSLIKEYEMRKSKNIRFAPTDKEIREAVRMYKFMLDDSDEGNKSSLKFKEMLDDITYNVEEQIKLFGFMFETLEHHPDGTIPHELFMEKAEKWNVLDYMFEDMIRVYLRKLGEVE